MPFDKKEAPNCDWCSYRKNCFFDLLDEKSSRQYWKEMRTANRFRAGEVVFHEGEKPNGFYVVCTGKVKIYKSSRTGQQLTTRVESPGDLVGHRAMLAGDDYASTAEAMDESVISRVDESVFKDFLLKHPKASLALLRALAIDVRRGEDKARDIAFKPARSRLALTLIDHGRPNKNGKPSVTGVKRKELAEMSGLTIETTVRLLKDFVKRGLIKKQGKDLLIIHPTELQALSERYS